MDRRSMRLDPSPIAGSDLRGRLALEHHCPGIGSEQMRVFWAEMVGRDRTHDFDEHLTGRIVQIGRRLQQAWTSQQPAKVRLIGGNSWHEEIPRLMALAPTLRPIAARLKAKAFAKGPGK